MQPGCDTCSVLKGRMPSIDPLTSGAHTCSDMETYISIMNNSFRNTGNFAYLGLTCLRFLLSKSSGPKSFLSISMSYT